MDKMLENSMVCYTDEEHEAYWGDCEDAEEETLDLWAEWYEDDEC